MPDLFEDHLFKLRAGFPILKEGLGTPVTSPDIKRMSVSVINTDPDLVPISFEMECNFNITFDCPKIAEKYNKVEHDDMNDDSYNMDSDEDAYDTNVVDKKTVTKKEKNVIMDYDEVKYEILLNNFPSYRIKNKINDLIRERKFTMGDFEITAITYSTQVTDKLLISNFEKYDKRNKSKKKLKMKYGYAFAIESKSRQLYSTKEIKEFCISFAKQLQDLILIDTEYYIITK